MDKECQLVNLKIQYDQTVEKEGNTPTSNVLLRLIESLEKQLFG
jgi:hypothetical protein